MPAVVMEMLPFRIAVHRVDDGAIHQAAPDLHIRQFVPAGRQGLIEQFGKPIAESEIHPVSVFDHFGRFRRGHDLVAVFF